MARPEGAVVVGVDGSEPSARAAAWAAEEARRRRARLHLVLVTGDPARSEQGGEIVHRLAERCRAGADDVEVGEEVLVGHPVQSLLRREETAALLVLGSHGMGGFAEAMLGSVSSEVAKLAVGTVVVVRGREYVGGPVVVGVDDAAEEAVLRFAFDAAAARGAELVAVRARHARGGLAPEHGVLARAELSVAANLVVWRDRYPAVEVSAHAVRGHPVPALVDAASGAALLVVGHRGSGGFGGLLAGSVAVGVLHHARCPVAVVR
ncbi:universal stress protein [Saccharopolyspora sp. MS10]|uniref:universal stress protein n=1 Tax=Saccharopolyspora sp. MS10 TaxID=3385973 RepID=UPI0039A18AF8